MNEILRDPHEVAEWLGTNIRTLAQWRYLGKGPRFVKVGKLVRYRESDIQTWLDANVSART